MSEHQEFHIDYDRFKQLADHLATFQMVQNGTGPTGEILLWRNVKVDGINFPPGLYHPKAPS